MMDETKYKTLKTKHDLLKDAFKKLYGDYETIKVDLSSRIEEYSKLHEELTHLKHSYDLLADEVSQQNQKTTKPGPSSWANPLTLIKGSGQQSSVDADVHQKYNDEIASLKSRLESSIKENELLQVQNLQTTRDLEDSKAKHNVVVTELKDRLIALESILKDLQDQSNKNETKLSQYSSEIKSLNVELENKSAEISNLNRSLDNVKKDHERDSLEWKLKLNEKFKFDLRRNNFINSNNVYQNYNQLDTLKEEFSTQESFKVLVSSLLSLFNSWRSSLKFVECSGISGDQDSRVEEPTSLDSHNGPDVSSFSSISSPENLVVSNNMDFLVQRIDYFLVKVCSDLEAVLLKMEEGIFDSVQYRNLSSLVENFSKFFKFQRVYFCVEEYLVPYGSDNSSKEGNRRSTYQLITILGSLFRVLRRLYFNLRSVLYLVQLKRKNLSGFLLMVLNNESVSSTKHSDISESNTDSKVYDTYKNDLSTVNTLLGNSSKSMFSQVKHLSSLVNELKESLSHRLCYPKVAGGKFLPFSGGTNQMVYLTSVLSNLEKDLTHVTEYRVNSVVNYLFTSLKYYSHSHEDFDFGNYEVQTHSTISYLNGCNQLLSNSQPRIKLVNLERDLHVAKRNENELSGLRLKFSDMEELLSMATHRSERYEHELDSLRQTNLLESICSKMFSSLEAKYTDFHYIQAEGSNSQIEEELRDSSNKIKKLSTHIKHLMRTVTSLEDSNRQLKLALELNKDQYRLAKENEDSIHRNYNEQLVLMSEHISELNNAILSSEYKIAELTQTKVSCPSCGFNNTLGSMMGVDDKGRCSSCRCIVIFSTN